MNASYLRLLLMLLAFVCLASEAAAQKPELVVSTGHTDQISAVVVSPSGKFYTTASWDNTIKICDTASGAILRTLAGHTKKVVGLAISPDGNTLASSSEDSFTILWDIATGAPTRKLVTPGTSVGSLAFDRDGKILAGGGDQKIYLWEISSGTLLQSIWDPHAPNTVFAEYLVALSHDGKTLAAAFNNGTRWAIKLWDLTSDAERAVLERRSTGNGPPSERLNLLGHNNRITALRFSPDDQLLISASWDQSVKIWDAKAGKELQTIGNNNGPIGAAAISGDGNRLVFAINGDTAHGVLKIWDLKQRQELRTIVPEPGTVNISALDLSPDGETLIGAVKTNSRHPLIKTWAVASGAETNAVANPANGVKSLAFSPDGKRLLSGSRALSIWGAMDAAPRVIGTRIDPVGAVAFSPDGRWAAAPYDHDSTRQLAFAIKLIDLRDDRKSLILAGHANTITSLSFTPDSKSLVSFGWDQSVIVWDTSNGKATRTIKAGSPLTKCGLSADGRIVAVSEADINGREISLWSTSDGKKLPFQIRDADTPVRNFAFSPNGRLLAGAGYHRIRVWDLTTGALVHKLAGHNGSVNSVAFSPDGQYLASGGDDKTVRLWNLADGALVQIFTSHTAEVNAVAFSPDGKLLASASNDTTVKLWEVDRGRELATLVSKNERDWLVVTPDGLFDGSPSGWEQVLWRYRNNTFDVTPVEAYFSEFFHPGLLTEILAQKSPVAPRQLQAADRRQLPVNFLSSNTPDPMGPLTSRTVTLQVRVQERTDTDVFKDDPAGRSVAPSGARDLRIFRNGSLVKHWAGDDLFTVTEKNGCKLQPEIPERSGRTTICTVTVPTIAGENRFTAYAFNRQNVKSRDAVLVVTGADSLKRTGTAYLVAVGVNEYANGQYNLKYATADAQDFATEMRAKQDALGQYAKVEVVSLYDRDATKEKILAALSGLAAKVQPEDAVIIYFAGHGVAAGNRFYLVPHDLRYLGPRNQLDQAGLGTILAHSISDEELQATVEGIDAGQMLIVIDACNSGQALEAEEKRRGPMNSRGLAQLAYEKGIYILTAAQSYQAALEASKLGHGYLTYALVEEGLKTPGADVDKDGSVFLREWLDYATSRVPAMQQEILDQAATAAGQKPPATPSAQRLLLQQTVTFTNGEEQIDPALRTLQRPRVFYRREVEARPLVVARP